MVGVVAVGAVLNDEGEDTAVRPLRLYPAIDADGRADGRDARADWVGQDQSDIEHHRALVAAVLDRHIIAERQAALSPLESTRIWANPIL